MEAASEWTRSSWSGTAHQWIMAKELGSLLCEKPQRVPPGKGYSEEGERCNGAEVKLWREPGWELGVGDGGGVQLSAKRGL